MPRINIKDIEIFHRDDYPATSGRLTTPEETISIIIDPKFTDSENKAGDFFTFKPKRFEFSVRYDNTTFFRTKLEIHPVFSELSDYMIRVFDSGDNQIYEGIIEATVSYDEDTQLYGVTVYDPVVLFGDSDQRYSTYDLNNGYKNPMDLYVLLMTDVMNRYFTSSTYKPSYSTDWEIPVADLFTFQDMYDFEDIITNFYSDVVSTYKAAAVAAIGSITEFIDCSRIDVVRDTSIIDGLSKIPESAVFQFVGLVVYRHRHSNNPHHYSDYVISLCNGCRYDFTNGVQDLEDNVISAHTGTRHIPYTDTDFIATGSGHKGSYKYLGSNIRVAQAVTGDNTSGVLDKVDSRDFVSEFVTLDTLIDNLSVGYFAERMKTEIVSRWFPDWNSNYQTPLLTIPTQYGVAVSKNTYSGTTEYEKTYNYFEERKHLFNSNHALLSQGGTIIDVSADVPITGCDYGDFIVCEGGLGENSTGKPNLTNIYSSHANSSGERYFYGYVYWFTRDTWRYIGMSYPAIAIRTEVTDFDTGLIRLTKSGVDMYKIFKINYGLEYPLSWSSLGLANSDRLIKSGNISKGIGYLPSDIQVKDLGEDALDYIYNIPSGEAVFYKIIDLMKMLLATMNLYLYYDDGFKIVNSFLTTVPTAISVADSDVIGWKENQNKLQSLDISSVTKPLLNYTANALNPYYNSILELDTQRASCLVSRKINTYNLIINSVVTIKGANWRIDSIATYAAYYSIELTKYITEP